MKNKLLWILVGIPAATLIVTSSTGCEGDDQKQLAPVGVTLASNRECPFHEDRITVGEPGAEESYDTLPLVGPITGIPEFHDCQRFIGDSAKSYGPLVAIYATNNLAGRTLTPAPSAPEVDATNQPVVADPARVSEAVLPAGPVSDAVALGIIVDFDQVAYAPLGIEPGFNCLFVFPQGGSPNGLGAKVVPVGTNVQKCTSGATRSERGTDLVVYTKRMNLDHPNDYPPVARWDWDQKTSRQYIGIRCGPRWCEIGPQGFLRSDTHLFPGLGDPKERRVFAVKGWHDEQWLAHPVAGAPGAIVPKPFRGTLVPVKNLSSLKIAAFRGPDWVTVAGVAITPHDSDYQGKFGFTEATMPGTMNKVALCNGDWAACIAKGGSPAVVPTEPACPPTDDGTWWARITSTTGSHRYFCVKRNGHAGITMPGTARWRWLNTDETIWIECDAGCCQVQGGKFGES